MAIYRNVIHSAYSRNEGRPPDGLALFLLLALFAFNSVGCGGGERRQNQPSQTPIQNTTAPGRVRAPSQSSPESPEDHDEEYLEIGWALMGRESLGPLKYGMSSADVLTRFGEPEEKSEAIEWGADGLIHQSWYYRVQGIELDMARDGEPGADSGIGVAEFTVNMITITAPCGYRTIRGVGIGTTRDEVLLLYVDEANPELRDEYPDWIVAGSAYGGIIFYLRSNRVSKIFIGAAAE